MMKLCLLTTILVLVAGSPTPPVFPDAVNCTLHGRSDSNFEFIGRLFYDYNLSSIRVEKNYTKVRSFFSLFVSKQNMIMCSGADTPS
jgi:hypothetical protein